MTGRLDGADGSLALGSLTLKWRGEATWNLTPRVFDGRGTGDNTAQPKSGSGLTTDSNITINGVLLDDWTSLLVLNGTEATATMTEGATTVFLGTVYINATQTASATDMALANLVLVPTAMPTTPSMSGIAMS